MDSHHTKEQIQEAFAKAPGILKELEELGAALPRFTLFVDGSGSLNLGDAARVTSKIYKRATELVKSVRTKQCLVCLDNALDDKKTQHEHQIAIEFCCGLVDHN